LVIKAKELIINKSILWKFRRLNERI